VVAACQSADHLAGQRHPENGIQMDKWPWPWRRRQLLRSGQDHPVVLTRRKRAGDKHLPGAFAVCPLQLYLISFLAAPNLILNSRPRTCAIYGRETLCVLSFPRNL